MWKKFGGCVNWIEIKPKGRDAAAKACYLFMSWWVRCNRYDLERKFNRELRNLMIYGTTHPNMIVKED